MFEEKEEEEEEGINARCTTGGVSAAELLQRKQSLRPIFTLSRSLDLLLGGGIQIGEITEFCTLLLLLLMMMMMMMMV